MCEQSRQGTLGLPYSGPIQTGIEACQRTGVFLNSSNKAVRIRTGGVSFMVAPGTSATIPISQDIWVEGKGAGLFVWTVTSAVLAAQVLEAPAVQGQEAAPKDDDGPQVLFFEPAFAGGKIELKISHGGYSKLVVRLDDWSLTKFDNHGSTALYTPGPNNGYVMLQMDMQQPYTWDLSNDCVTELMTHVPIMVSIQGATIEAKVERKGIVDPTPPPTGGGDTGSTPDAPDVTARVLEAYAAKRVVVWDAGFGGRAGWTWTLTLDGQTVPITGVYEPSAGMYVGTYDAALQATDNALMHGVIEGRNTGTAPAPAETVVGQVAGAEWTQSTNDLGPEFYTLLMPVASEKWTRAEVKVNGKAATFKTERELGWNVWNLQDGEATAQPWDSGQVRVVFKQLSGTPTPADIKVFAPA